MDNESHNLLISSRINELAKERNISINELSKRSKIPQSTLANILVRKKIQQFLHYIKFVRG